MSHYLALSFTIPGKPVPKGRPRTAIIRGRSVVYTPKDTRAWEDSVGSIARAHMAGLGLPPDFMFDEDVCLHLSVSVSVPRPKQLLKAHERDDLMNMFAYAPSGSDLDNIVKSVADGLQLAKIIKNDSRIARIIAIRKYDTSGNDYHTDVSIGVL